MNCVGISFFYDEADLEMLFFKKYSFFVWCYVGTILLFYGYFYFSEASVHITELQKLLLQLLW